MKKRQKRFGAATDDPVALADRAIEEAKVANGRRFHGATCETKVVLTALDNIRDIAEHVDKFSPKRRKK